MENIEEDVIVAGDNIINLADNFDGLVRKLNRQNEQWFIDWQNKLNKISVR